MNKHQSLTSCSLLLVLLASILWMIANHQSQLSGALYLQSTLNFKLPRVLIDLLTGSLFALAGALLQSSMNNKITSPDILGISSTSILCVLGVKSAYPEASWVTLSITALLGSIASFTFLAFIAKQNGKINLIKFVLIGVTIGVLCKAGNQWLLQQSSPEVINSLSYMTGSSYNTSWQKVVIISCFTLPLLILIAGSHRLFRYLALSDNCAKGIGIPLNKTRKLSISLALICTTIAIMGIGNLGFVGLVAPNIARVLSRNNPLFFLIYSAVIGMVIVIAADALASLIFYPTEVPVGIVTTLIGAPYFIALIHKQLK